MKKWISAMLALILCLSFAACGSAGQQGSTSVGQEPEEKQGSTITQEPESQHTGESVPAEQTAQEADKESDDSASEAPEADDPTDANAVLVVYFSATGTTGAVAEKIASVTGADLYEITPAQPYSSDDLNYNDSSTRATREQHDKTIRPEISSRIENWDLYSIVFLGHPIWWGEEPRIMDTFVESYDFTGKTVIPFCTSGSSGVGSSDDNMKANAGAGAWLEGTRFSGSVLESEIQTWVDGLGLGLQREAVTEMNSALDGDQIRITVGERSFIVRLEDNESAAALRELLTAGDRTISASNYGGFEKVCQLGTSLPRNDVQTTTSAGDVMLYSGNQIVIFYGSNSWAYTRLGKVEDLSADELEQILSGSETEITLSIY